MNKIELTLKTTEGPVEFEVVKLDGKYHLFNKMVDLRGRQKTIRIGTASTWPDVVNIARIFTGKPVLEMEGTPVHG